MGCERKCRADLGRVRWTFTNEHTRNIRVTNPQAKLEVEGLTFRSVSEEERAGTRKLDYARVASVDLGQIR